MKRIGDILTRHKTPVTVESDVIYKQVTIRTNYKGVVLRGTQSGSTILTKSQWRVSAGQFILSRIDARNGAFGIIPDELEGAIVTNDFLAFDINETEVEREFFNVFLQSPVFLEACIKASRGNTNRKRVDEEFFLDFEVNLQPIAEQYRLIHKINAARAGVTTAEQEIAHQETLLAKLKQAILQEAITGKLTAGWRAAQTDVEPASQLLARIRAEKKRLVAAKKLRPEKPLPPIPESEIPFAIPEGWEWCRLGSIAQHSLGKMLDAGKNKGAPRPYLRNMNVQWFNFVLSDLKQMPFEEHEFDKYSVMRGDVLICEGGYPGQSAVWESDEAIMFQKALHRVRFIACAFIPKLFVHYLKLGDNTGLLRKYYTGSGIQHFTGDSLHSFPIPLPPLREQTEIVARVEDLMERCRELEAEIERSRAHAAALLQAVLREAFAPASAIVAAIDTRPALKALTYLLQFLPALARATGSRVTLDQLNSATACLFLPKADLLPLVGEIAGSEARDHFAGLDQPYEEGAFLVAVKTLLKTKTFLLDADDVEQPTLILTAKLPPISPEIDTDARFLAPIVARTPAKTLARSAPRREKSTTRETILQLV